MLGFLLVFYHFEYIKAIEQSFLLSIMYAEAITIEGEKMFKVLTIRLCIIIFKVKAINSYNNQKFVLISMIIITNKFQGYVF